MFRLTFLIAILPLIFGDHHEHEPFDFDYVDGPCPQPAVDAEHSADFDFTGNWYAVCTSIEALTKKRLCSQIVVESDKDDGIYATRHYTDGDTLTDVKVDVKFVPIGGGRFTEYYKHADGLYESTGWVHSTIKIHGNTCLEHVCKEEGGKHFDFYRAWTKTVPVAEEDKKVMEEAYKATGDGKTHYMYNDENCTFKLH